MENVGIITTVVYTNVNTSITHHLLNVLLQIANKLGLLKKKKKKEGWPSLVEMLMEEVVVMVTMTTMKIIILEAIWGMKMLPISYFC
jgi:uncharacterized protein (DUF362 family)